MERVTVTVYPSTMDLATLGGYVNQILDHLKPELKNSYEIERLDLRSGQPKGDYGQTLHITLRPNQSLESAKGEWRIGY